MMDPKSIGNNDRYSRQIRFAGIGEEGQARIAKSRVLVVGVGALGSASAEMLARAGVGYLRLVDRDFVDWSNLQRQSLFDEADAEAGAPKAVAAVNRLRAINSTVCYDAHVADVVPSNLEPLLKDIDLIIDGTDHFDIRYLINDAAWKFEVPWIFGGCLGADGQVIAFVPPASPCLQCWMPAGAGAEADTCDTVGVIGPIVHTIAAMQVTEALKIMAGQAAAVHDGLQAVALWDNRCRTISGGVSMKRTDCPTCGVRSYEWLTGTRFSKTTRLCGRNSVQVSPGEAKTLDLETLAGKLKSLGPVTQNAYLLRIGYEGLRATIFADGRAIIEGTDDEARARGVYHRLLG